MPNRAKTRSPGCRGETILKESSCARLILRRTGPEDPLLSFDFLIGDARIIGNTSCAGTTQLFENLTWLCKGKILLFAKQTCQIAQYGNIGTHSGWRVKSAFASDYPPFQIGHCAFFLRPLRRWQYDIGHLSRL